MLTSLDKDDILILHLLQHDSRMTNKEIADRIGKSVSPVYERIRRLENEGIIRQYVALLDRRKVNRGLCAYVNVQLKEHAAGMMSTFEKEVIRFNEVMECYHMTGHYDFLLKVEVKDMDAYYTFMRDHLATLSNVGTVQSFFVLNEAKKDLSYKLDSALQKTRNTELAVKRKGVGVAV
jgi:DNA-binding Lrp family transcriptional regulator